MALLAHLYSHIRGSQEDIATMSLQYVVAQSNELNRAFTQELARALELALPDTLNYSVQSSGKDRERPDISGGDDSGREVVLCEAKFYAGLTANQPIISFPAKMPLERTDIDFILPYFAAILTFVLYLSHRVVNDDFFCALLRHRLAVLRRIAQRRYSDYDIVLRNIQYLSHLLRLKPAQPHELQPQRHRFHDFHVCFSFLFRYRVPF